MKFVLDQGKPPSLLMQMRQLGQSSSTHAF